MKNYKDELQKLVDDIRNKVFAEEEIKESLVDVTKNYEKIQEQLTELIKGLNGPKKVDGIEIIDNAQFMKLMGISQKTAQTWRDSGVVSYSQIGNKLFYKIADIQGMLDKNYFSCK
jgi:hypothetical protein